MLWGRLGILGWAALLLIGFGALPMVWLVPVGIILVVGAIGYLRQNRSMRMPEGTSISALISAYVTIGTMLFSLFVFAAWVYFIGFGARLAFDAIFG